MKKNTHPETHKITVVLTNGDQFETRSVYGKEGDVLHLDIDPLTHPAWTGTGQKLMDTAGQIGKFNKKYNLKI
ncbi:MAG: 50S ribosomal protein L31 [Holosporales bacterium]|jgi:large subunit ribosomal protein L31|nr:50S ribosomal protein L31 [Holosporales bacterium]